MGNAIWETQKNYSDPTTPPPSSDLYAAGVSPLDTTPPPPGGRYRTGDVRGRGGFAQSPGTQPALSSVAYL